MVKITLSKLKICSRFIQRLNSADHWEVHSKFTHAVNLVNASGEMLTFLTQNRVVAPYSVTLPILQLDDWRMVQRRFIPKGDIRGELEKYHFDFEEIDLRVLNKKGNTEWSKGLYSSVQSFSVRKSFNLLKWLQYHDFSDPEIREFQSCCFSDSGSWSKEFLKHWVGRGLGLTPSGDDFLVGLGFVLKVLSQNSQQYFELLDDMKRSTTFMSEYMFNCAVDGLFVEPLNRLCRTNDAQEMEKYLEELVQIGHSSGQDMFMGLWFGLKYAFFECR